MHILLFVRQTQKSITKDKDRERRTLHISHCLIDERWCNCNAVGVLYTMKNCQFASVHFTYSLVINHLIHTFFSHLTPSILTLSIRETVLPLTTRLIFQITATRVKPFVIRYHVTHIKFCVNAHWRNIAGRFLRFHCLAALMYRANLTPKW